MLRIGPERARPLLYLQFLPSSPLRTTSENRSRFRMPMEQPTARFRIRCRRTGPVFVCRWSARPAQLRIGCPGSDPNGFRNPLPSYLLRITSGRSDTVRIGPFSTNPQPFAAPLRITSGRSDAGKIRATQSLTTTVVFRRITPGRAAARPLPGFVRPQHRPVGTRFGQRQKKYAGDRAPAYFAYSFSDQSSISIRLNFRSNVSSSPLPSFTS